MDNHLIQNPQDPDFFWNQISRFKNIESTAEKLAVKHNTGGNYKKFIRKQAEQIGCCLELAKEYFIAARTVSNSTKAVLQYYGIMHLAMAEFLFKQNGNSSLDKIRERNRHHGLEFTFDQTHFKSRDFVKIATGLRSKPFIRDGINVGTFGVWNRSTSEYPQIGKVKTVHSNIAEETTHILAYSNGFLEPIQKSGFNLFELLASLPFLESSFKILKSPRNYTRGRISAFHNVSNNQKFLQITVQPGQLVEIPLLLDQFQFSPCSVPLVEIVDELGGGVIFKIHHETYSGISETNNYFPNGVQYVEDELYWYVNQLNLNEFGIIYCALHKKQFWEIFRDIFQISGLSMFKTIQN